MLKNTDHFRYLTKKICCCERFNFFKLEQKLRIFAVLLMLVCIIKLDLSKISLVEFLNVKALKVFTNQQIKQPYMK